MSDAVIRTEHNAPRVPTAGLAETATILVAQAGTLAVRTGGSNDEVLQTAMHTLGQIKPEGVQSMLAVQMIGVHNSTVRFLMRATDARPEESADANDLRANSLMRLFKEQLDALAGLRGGGTAKGGR